MVHFDKRKELLDALDLPTDVTMRARVTVLADLARAEIIRLAKERLKTSEREYVAAVQPVEMHGSTAKIVLNPAAVLPGMIENGWPTHDLRDTILRSPKAHLSKAGHKYLAIPFEHAMSGSGRNRPVVGEAYAREEGRTQAAIAFAETLRRDVRSAARRLAPTTTTITPDGQRSTQWGDRLPTDQGGPRMRERHVTGLYAGMVRFQKTYAKATQSTYGTFRMISDNPATHRYDEKGLNWTHPGIIARNLFVVARDYVEKMIPAVIRGT